MRNAFLIHLPQWAWILVPDYSVMLVISMAIGCWVISGKARSDGWTRGRALLILVPALVVAMAGAKIGYLLQYDPRSIYTRPLDSLLVAGGYSLFGAMVAVALFGLLCIHPTNLSLGLFADATGYGLMLMLCLIRFGCFMSGCNYGSVTSLPWGLRFPAGSPAFNRHVALGLISPDVSWSLPVHPTQLYESALGLGLFWLARDLWPRRKFNGQLYIIVCVIYTVFRFFLELVRDDAGGIAFGPLTFAQVTCLALLALLALGYWNAVRWKLLFSPPRLVRAREERKASS
ncbi:MAG: prolipoprotein diacylglyceryl transferase family protein [Acidobacteriota bacterium]